MEADLEYYMENWLKNVQHTTIQTVMVPLELQQLQLISKLFSILHPLYFNMLKNIQKQQSQEIPLGNQNWLLLPECQTIIKNNTIFQTLINKINTNMTAGKSYFIKLSLRSAKDSLALKKKEQKVEALLTEQGNKNAREESYRLGLVVCDALEALQQICTSQRIFDDIERYKKTQQTGIHLALRPWLIIPHSLQFRLFVHERNLTAISAYYKAQIYPFLASFKQEIQKEIHQWFEKQLKSQLPFENSVLDVGFALKLDKQLLYVDEELVKDCLSKRNYRIILIQINPFGKCSGSALFSWWEPVLTKGPLQFRLVHQETLY